MFGTFKVDVEVINYSFNASDIDDLEVVDPFKEDVSDEDLWDRKEDEARKIEDSLPKEWQFEFDCEEDEIEELARREIEDRCGYAPGSLIINYDKIN